MPITPPKSPPYLQPPPEKKVDAIPAGGNSSQSSTSAKQPPNWEMATLGSKTPGFKCPPPELTGASGKAAPYISDPGKAPPNIPGSGKAPPNIPDSGADNFTNQLLIERLQRKETKTAFQRITEARLIEIAEYAKLVNFESANKHFLPEPLFQQLAQVALISKFVTKFWEICVKQLDNTALKMRTLVDIIKWLLTKVAHIGSALSKLEASDAREDLVCDMELKVFKCQFCWEALCTMYDFAHDEDPFDEKFQKPFSAFPTAAPDLTHDIAGGNSSHALATLLREFFTVTDFRKSQFYKPFFFWDDYRDTRQSFYPGALSFRECIQARKAQHRAGHDTSKTAEEKLNTFFFGEISRVPC